MKVSNILRAALAGVLLSGSAGQAMMQTARNQGLVFRDGWLGYPLWFCDFSQKNGAPLDFFDEKMGNLSEMSLLRPLVEEAKEGFPKGTDFEKNPRYRVVQTGVSLLNKTGIFKRPSHYEPMPHHDFNVHFAVKNVLDEVSEFTTKQNQLYVPVRFCLIKSRPFIGWGERNSAYSPLEGGVISARSRNVAELNYLLLSESGHLVEHLLAPNDPHYRRRTEIYSQLWQLGGIVKWNKRYHSEIELKELLTRSFLFEHQRLNMMGLFLSQEKVFVSDMFQKLGVTELDPTLSQNKLTQVILAELKEGLKILKGRSRSCDLVSAAWALALEGGQVSRAMRALKETERYLEPEDGLERVPHFVEYLQSVLGPQQGLFTQNT